MFDLYNTKGQVDFPKIALNDKLHAPELYVPSKGLMSAVNVAIHLNLPLLLTGEPGTGKTELAHHLAWHFKLGEPLVFDAQTTSTAKDLFYHYDALGHFQYSQTQKLALDSTALEEKFIRFRALGKAIQQDKKALVLVDEIDKAPRDLPNDILAALENLSFDVPETGAKYSAKPENRPLIVMTSNSEKNLPDAFLRRVVYYHIPFPDKNALLQILAKKIAGVNVAELEILVKHFEQIRSGEFGKLRKNPATAELIQWVLLIQKMGFKIFKLQDIESLSSDELELLHASYSILGKNKDDLKLLTYI